jgi:lycopene beta-cyclase
LQQLHQHTENTFQELVYDYIFIGMGASNSLILKKLIESNTFKNKKVAVIEAQQKNENDKTYCFWASPKDPIVSELNAIISHSYKKIEINKTLSQDISSHPYYYIKSIDLYQYTSNLIEQNKIAKFQAKCFDIVENSTLCAVHTDHGVFQAKLIFDSRPPKIDNTNHIHLHQSFYGLQVKFNKELFDSNAFEMMNFDVEQDQFTQFFYVLPFSNKEALIELTRFGAEKINIDYAKDVLAKKIELLFGPYEVVTEEIGCIPMTNYSHPQSELIGVVNTGARANLIKPSTGYGFKKMFLYAEEISQSISNLSKGPVAEHSTSFHTRHRVKQERAFFAKATKVKGSWGNFNSKSRFKFYDSLLLIILLRWPYLGKEIFSKLFRAQKISTVFSFLDETTNLLQEIKIFASLPFKPFLKAAFIQIFKNISVKNFSIALAISTYFLISSQGSPFTETYMYSIIVIGLLLIGIPHGAVDHLLKRDSKPLIYFIAKYLLIMALNFILWIISPILALSLFLLYSSFHFGESELESFGDSTQTIKSALKAASIGALILFIVVFGHWQESISILKNIDGLWPKNAIEIQINSITFYALVSFAFIGLFLCLYQNKKNFVQLVLILFIGLFLPLIAAFSLYFVCQHSFNAWQDLKKGLSLNSIQLYKKAWPYLLGAFAVFMSILGFNSVQDLLLKNIWSNFFIFLSCISLPHVFFMHGYYRGQQ